MYSRTHQWYWSTEYSDYINERGNLEFDSYMLPESDLELGDLRLLEVDNRLILPIDTHVRILVTSADVIHSLALPSLGVKIDCIPGDRLVYVRLSISGSLYSRAIINMVYILSLI